jgi:hypothetical protein
MGQGSFSGFEIAHPKGVLSLHKSLAPSTQILNKLIKQSSYIKFVVILVRRRARLRLGFHFNPKVQFKEGGL